MDAFFKAFASVLAFFYDVTGNYALAIIALTLLVMIIVTPLTLKGTRSMMMMQQLQPEMKKIQTRYKDDRQKLNEELLKFYKENNINPLGGCLPLLVQMPVFLVLYQVLRGLTQRVSDLGADIGWVSGQVGIGGSPSKAPFFERVFDPAWISPSSKMYENLSTSYQMKAFGLDLAESASQAMKSGILHALPFLVLIAIVAFTGFVQQRQIQGRNPSAQSNPQQQMIMKIMPFFLPLISFTLSAGLVVYFVVSNLWRVGQQAFITRTLYNNAKHPPIIESTAVEVPAEAKKTPAKAVRATRVTNGSVAIDDDDLPSRSVMGRNRREGTAAKAARLPAPAKPKPVSPTVSGRVTPSGSSATARPAKTKKKRK